MIRSLIVAHDANGLIGVGGALPWRIPAEMAHFRARTEWKAVVMGRRTFQSIGQRLAQRINIVLSREGFTASCVHPASSLREAFEYAEHLGFDECVVIGGASVYAEAWPLVSRAYVSRIEHAYDVKDGVYLPACDRSYRVTRRADVSATDSTPAWSAEVREF